MRRNKLWLLLVTLVIILSLTACTLGPTPVEATPTPRPVEATTTPIPLTPLPTATPIPPTATPIPLTPTPVPPAATPTARKVERGWLCDWDGRGEVALWSKPALAFQDDNSIRSRRGNVR